jgi:DNA-binding response OmpR family regulator
MKVILEHEGYLVDFAVSGAEAIQKTQETLYNVAFLDIRLPDMEGVELLQLIKDGVPRTRKIMLTGYPSMQNAIAALNENADAYLVKPVKIESLLSTVKKQLQLQNGERKFTEEKVAEFIETRVNELKMNSV